MTDCGILAAQPLRPTLKMCRRHIFFTLRGFAPPPLARQSSQSSSSTKNKTATLRLRRGGHGGRAPLTDCGILAAQPLWPTLKMCRRHIFFTLRGFAPPPLARQRFSIVLFHQNKTATLRLRFCWWKRVDSNHRRRSQQIYSLSPLATWVLFHIQLVKVELVDGFEPPTC